MVLRNYVELVAGRPTALHFTDHALMTKTIQDPVMRIAKPVNTLTFVVDQMDGQPVGALFSVTAEKLAQKLQPFLGDKSYVRHTFVITARGEGFLREYSVEVRPLQGA